MKQFNLVLGLGVAGMLIFLAGVIAEPNSTLRTAGMFIGAGMMCAWTVMGAGKKKP
jgi:hypothetical protein